MSAMPAMMITNAVEKIAANVTLNLKFIFLIQNQHCAQYV